MHPSKTYQGAEKNTRTGRDSSFERTLSENSFSVSIIFPPDFAIPNRVVILAALVVDDTVLVLLLIEGDIIVKDCDGKLLLLFGDEK
jgi:hypothetical protein